MKDQAAAMQSISGSRETGPGECSGSVNVNVTTTTMFSEQSASTSTAVGRVVTSEYQPMTFYLAVQEEHTAVKRLKLADTKRILKPGR